MYLRSLLTYSVHVKDLPRCSAESTGARARVLSYSYFCTGLLQDSSRVDLVYPQALKVVILGYTNPQILVPKAFVPEPLIFIPSDGPTIEKLLHPQALWTYGLRLFLGLLTGDPGLVLLIIKTLTLEQF